MRIVPVALVAAVILVSAACGGDDGAGGFDSTRFDGTYEGTWTNEQSGATGPVTIAIDTDEETGTASLEIDFGGNYLGLGDPPAAELSGTFDENGAVVKGTSPLFGDYDVTIDPDGAIVGLMEDLAGGVVPKLSYTGTVTGEKLDADYEVTLPDGSTSTSILRMTKRG